jgi:protein-S-isoprenylcysteine O-methyltransferase Ste14
MEVIVTQAVGAAVFLVGTILLGRRLRRVPDERLAKRASRVSHLLFWVALILPGALGIIHPGLTHYDELLGVSGLPGARLWIPAGAALACVGIGLMVAANRALMRTGRGAAAFVLTERLVGGGVYGRTRNPMSLGLYAACLGVAMIAGSLTVTLGVLLILLPVHAFNLKYFEERELELRYGESYAEYKRIVPFLIPSFKRGGALSAQGRRGGIGGSGV